MTNFFCSSPYKDNLTETPIVRNSNAHLIVKNTRACRSLFCQGPKGNTGHQQILACFSHTIPLPALLTKSPKNFPRTPLINKSSICYCDSRTIEFPQRARFLEVYCSLKVHITDSESEKTFLDKNYPFIHKKKKKKKHSYSQGLCSQGNSFSLKNKPNVWSALRHN